MTARLDEPGKSAGDRKWYALAILTLVNICYFMDRSIIAVAMESLRREFGLSDTQLGLLYGATYVVAFSLASIPVGWLMDRHNRRNLLSGLIVLWSGLTAAGGLAQSYLWLVLARMGVGASEAGGPPACLSLISDYFQPRQRATAIGIWSTGATLGFALSFAIGGFVIQHYGWRSAFFLAGVPGALLAVTILLTFKEPVRTTLRTQDSDSHPAPGLREILAYIARQPSIAPLVTAIVLQSVATAGLAGFMAAFLGRGLHLPVGQAGMIVGLSMGLAGAVGVFLAGLIADRLAYGSGRNQPQRLAFVCAACTLLSAAAGFTMLTASAPSTAIAALFAFGLTTTAPVGPSHALLLSALPGNMRGTAAATISALSSLFGSGGGNFLVGALSDLYGGGGALRWAMATVLLLSVVATGFFLVAGRSAARAHLGSQRKAKGD